MTFDRQIRGARRLMLLRGDRQSTANEARRITAPLAPDAVLWVGDGHASRRQVRRMLGRSFDAVVVSLHDGLDADLLGQCHGFVVGGGALIVCAPEIAPPQPGLVAWGCDPADVGHALWDRVIAASEAIDTTHAPLLPPTFAPTGTPDQARAVAMIVGCAGRADVPVVVLTADRGRGKSAAVGLALGDVEGDVIVTAASRDAVAEVFAFAPDDERIRFVEPTDLVRHIPSAALLVVDEAAQLPVGLLEELTASYVATPIVFSTTTHGYEGTGRGFLLRFVERLRAGERPVIDVELRTPIRWSADDRLERAVFDALLLDAEPATPSAGAAEHRLVHQAELATNEELLREVFGLLVQAHYRTTPADLHRLLDAPNLAVHVSSAQGHVVAATLVAIEGGLDDETATAVRDGAMRIVGHALPDTFAAHLGYADAAKLSMVRSVRIATHPLRRRRGVATELVEHVHHSYDVDLFGTVFGATAELIAFRRSLGYEVVRLSASRGARTGVPSVVMVRPVTAPAMALVDQLRRDLARDLPTQLALFDADGVVRLDPALAKALLADLPAPAPLDAPTRAQIVRHYAYGPRTFESAAVALREELRDESLDVLDEALRVVIEQRVINERSWASTAAAASLSIPAAMRALRRAVRTLFDTRASR